MADERKGTEYVVLRRTAGGQESSVSEDGAESETRDVPNAYEEAGSAMANNDTAAIDAVANAFPDEDWSRGAIAVPARSFRLRVPSEKVTRRRLWS